MQIRFEGRIFFSSNKSCIQKVFSIALVRETLRVSLHLFWTWPSTKNFYEITEDSSFSVISSEHTNHNISWTECVNSLYNRRNISGQGQSKLPFSTSKICAEFKETSFAAAQRIQFLAVTLINHDPVSNREETVESSEAVSRTSSGNSSVGFRINKTNRLVVFNYPTSTFITNKFQVPKTTTNTGIKTQGSYFKKVILNRNPKEKLQ